MFWIICLEEAELRLPDFRLSRSLPASASFVSMITSKHALQMLKLACLVSQGLGPPDPTRLIMQTSIIVIRIDYIECIGLYEILYEGWWFPAFWDESWVPKVISTSADNNLLVCSSQTACL